jgi:hypothetical protein
VRVRIDFDVQITEYPTAPAMLSGYADDFANRVLSALAKVSEAVSGGQPSIPFLTAYQALSVSRVEVDAV